MSHASCSWLDRVPFLLPHSTPSLLSCVQEFLHLATRIKEFRLVVLPNRARPITGCQVNDPVEVSSSEVRTMLLPSRKASIGSTYNSGVGIATAPSLSEVDERSNLGMLSSPLLPQEGDQCSSIQDLSL